jgi:hypothetical protein
MISIMFQTRFYFCHCDANIAKEGRLAHGRHYRFINLACLAFPKAYWRRLREVSVSLTIFRHVPTYFWTCASAPAIHIPHSARLPLIVYMRVHQSGPVDCSLMAYQWWRDPLPPIFYPLSVLLAFRLRIYVCQQLPPATALRRRL